VIRCGLFGASTYYKALPDPVLRDYMQFCPGHWDPDMREGRKALIPAQRVVAALPDFSWGWAAVAGAYWKVAGGADNSQMEEEARAKGREAADRAVANWLGREELFKRAVAARRLDCGCEHHQYGWMLVDVGRTAEGLEHLHQWRAGWCSRTIRGRRCSGIEACAECWTIRASRRWSKNSGC
jgi:hypothetical protein